MITYPPTTYEADEHAGCRLGAGTTRGKLNRVRDDISNINITCSSEVQFLEGKGSIPKHKYGEESVVLEGWNTPVAPTQSAHIWWTVIERTMYPIAPKN